MNSTDKVLSFNNIEKIYPSAAGDMPILRGVSDDVYVGEWLGISGPSGSGKSTLLHILGAVDAPTRGEVLLLGEPIPFSDSRACDRVRASKIGFVFQYFNLLQHLTALENVMFPLLLNHVSSKDAKDRASEALCSVGLSHRADHLPTALSGGEQQRIALLRGTVHKPRVVIADEPTGNLDHKSRDLVLEVLGNLAQSGISVVMASHSAAALGACSRVMALDDPKYGGLSRLG